MLLLLLVGLAVIVAIALLAEVSGNRGLAHIITILAGNKRARLGRRVGVRALRSPAPLRVSGAGSTLKSRNVSVELGLPGILARVLPRH